MHEPSTTSPAMIGSLTLLLPLAARGVRAPAPQAPTLAGTWTLNEQKSDDVRKKMEDFRRGASNSPAVAGRPWGRDGANPGRPGTLGAGDRGGGGPGPAMMPVPRTLAIMVTDSTVFVDPGTGPPALLFTDGRRVEVAERPGAPPSSRTAKWDKQRLVVERNLGSGNRIVERYALDADGAALVVDTEVIMDRLGKISFRRVYDRHPEP